MTRRITFLNPIGGIGGAERILLAIVRQLRRQRPDFELSAILFGGGPLQSALVSLGVATEVLPLSEAAAKIGDTQLRTHRGVGRFAALAMAGLRTTPGLLAFIRKLRIRLRRLRPNLIHSNGLKTHLLSSLAAPFSVPLFWHIHDFYSQRPVMAKLLRQVSSRTARAIAISYAVRDDAAVVLPGLPVSVVRNAVDTNFYSPAPGDPALLDRLAGLPPAAPETIRVGLVATYAIWKGHDIFLQAVARLPVTEPVRYYIVGGPIYSTQGSQFTRAELESLAARLGLGERVGFVPFQPEPVNIYRALDVVVHSSTRPEPFGLTIAESMSCGRTVIVSSAGGAQELFTDGQDALSHRSGDVHSLAEAIAAMVRDPARRVAIGECARRTAVAHFAEDRLGREMLAVYSEYLKPPPDDSRRIGTARHTTVASPGEGRKALQVPKRVVFINPIGGLGGAEQSLLRILNIMSRFAPQVECRLLVGSEGPLLDCARALGVSAECFPMASALGQLGESGLRGHGRLGSRIRFLASLPRVSIEVLRLVRWLGDWFAGHQPDLIHSNGLKTHLLTALTRPQRTPLIWHIRDFLSARPLMRWNLRWLAPRATLAVANSRAVAADARRHFGRLPLVTLYNTVDTSHFFAAERDSRKLDDLANLPVAPPETIRIGLIATYANWKGHDVLLKAAARLLQTPPIRVYIVGEPIYATPGSQFTRAELKALADSLGLAGRVGFIPFQTDTANIYRKLDIVVHASTRPEPFGLTIAEAMACGRAVIVSDAGGASELFTEGIDALGHQPGNVDSLLAALTKLTSDPDLRKTLGDNARRTAVVRFAEEPFARNLLALYSDCLARVR